MRLLFNTIWDTVAEAFILHNYAVSPMFEDYYASYLESIWPKYLFNIKV